MAVMESLTLFQGRTRKVIPWFDSIHLSQLLEMSVSNYIYNSLPPTTMKRHLILIALTGLAASFSACSHSPKIQMVETGTVLKSAPGVVGPLVMNNGVAFQQYSPDLYTPFLYDHQSMASNNFYHAQALRHSGQKKGSVHVGPLTPVAGE